MLAQEDPVRRGLRPCFFFSLLSVTQMRILACPKWSQNRHNVDWRMDENAEKVSLSSRRKIKQ
jgi:hypothetical protein